MDCGFPERRGSAEDRGRAPLQNASDVADELDLRNRHAELRTDDRARYPPDRLAETIGSPGDVSRDHPRHSSDVSSHLADDFADGLRDLSSGSSDVADSPADGSPDGLRYLGGGA